MPYKDLEKRKEYHRKYIIKWKNKNPDSWKKIQDKSNSRPERKEYLKKWWSENPKADIIRKRFKDNNPKYQTDYCRQWDKENPDKVKLKQDKYSKTPKGVFNQIKKVQNRRNKFKILTKTYNQRPLKELVEIVDKRDVVCVYCHKEFAKDKNNRKDYRSYDHLDAFKPHSITNTVKCCGSCNSSKCDKEVFAWLKSKGYKPTQIIYELTTTQ